LRYNSRLAVRSGVGYWAIKDGGKSK